MQRKLRSIGVPALLCLVLATCQPRPASVASDQRSEPRRQSPAESDPPSRPVLELVESVPLETEWDQPDLRQTRAVWLEMIRGARRTIDLAQFYLANAPGEALEPVIAEILAAATRGVRVRVLVEKIFLHLSRQTLDRLAHHPEIQTAVYDIRALTGGILHAKYFIVDNRDAFVGSQNFDWRALDHIHELGLRVRRPALARRLARIFEADWRRAVGSPTAVSAAATPPGCAKVGALPASPPGCAKVGAVELLASPPALNPPGIRWAADRLVELLDGARRTVVVQLLTYSTVNYDGTHWRRVDDALRRAAARGVAIRMNISDWNKRKPLIDSLKALVRLPNIAIKLNTIPTHSGGFIPYARVDHCKFMVIDERVGWLGTSNWSGDYFVSSRNVDLVFEDARVVGQLVRIFEQGWAGPYAYDLDPEAEYAPPRRE